MDSLDVRIVPPKTSEPTSRFPRDQGFKPKTHQLSFFLYAGQLACALQQVVIDVECGSHLHQSAQMSHLLSSEEIRRVAV